MNLTKSKTAKLVSGFVGLAMALTLVVAPSSAGAQSASDLQAMINSLLAQIQSLQSQLAGATGGTSTGTGYQFNTNLTVGSTGVDVMELQKFLNMDAATQVSTVGAGSPGNETSFFGPATRAAVAKFQVKYGITPAVGYFGPLTRAKVNSMGVATTPTTPGTTLPTGGSLSVMAGSQPANSLAPQGASRVPFTTVTLTAGTADVTVNSITVERSGFAQNAVFSGVVLLDSNGTQIGVQKSLNSNNQAMVGEPFVVRAGTSMTVTIAGNMSSSLGSFAGQVAGLNVVGVNTSASVAGSFPIMGAQHTVNATLSLGTATVDRSTFDPASNQTKEIGTTNYKFSGVRVTAGSAEQIRLQSVRFNQTGSASSNDLANVMVYVDGTAYPTTVSADGKYYQAMFSGGILIDKGNSKDIYIQGDIIGTGAANRTVKFDIDRTTDLYLTGQTYNYGITPTGSGSGFGGGTPWYAGSTVTISAGSITTIQKATSVAAQNIAVNVPNQVLGGFQTDIKGEPISVQSMAFTIATTGPVIGTPAVITNITIIDQNGAVVAGPVDAVLATASTQTVTFTDTVTFPVGARTYTVRGRLPSSFGNASTIILNTTPSAWTNVRGEVTGNTITIGTGNFTMNTMTVKAAALNVSAATSPSAQNIVAGAQGVTFSTFQFDASQSGEDVRFSTLPVTITASNAVTDLTSCQLVDGSTALNTGSNTLNPTVAASTVTLDQQLVVAKGTVKSLTFRCNVSSSGTGTYQVGITSAPTVTGVTSGTTVTPTGTFVANGQVMTVGSGSLVVSTDSSSPSYTVVAAGTTGNTVGVYRFRATNEAVNLNRISLALDTNFASTSDLVSVSIWDGASQVGTAVFTGSSAYATSTLNSPVLLPKDEDKVLTVKVDLASIGSSFSGTQGNLIKIDVNGSDTTGTQGTGVGSGNTVNASGSTSVAGIRIFKSFPTLALDTLGSTGVADGRLLRFKVSANAAGSIGVQEFNFTVATTSATVTNVALYAFNDASYSSPISGQGTGGQIGSTAATVPTNVAFTINPASNPVQVSAGQTVYLELRGSVAGVTTGSSVVTKLLGDATYNGLAAAASVTGNFVWSGNATTTSLASHVDWSNGAALPGFPSSGLIQTRSN